MPAASGATGPLAQADWVAPERLVSAANPTIKLARSLHHPKGRQQAAAFLVEGERAVIDALQHGQSPRVILIREDYVPATAANREILRHHRAVIRVVAKAIFPSLTETVTPQGIVAIFPFPRLEVEQGTIPLVVVADGLQDPGNLGTLLRSAAGAGATLVLITPQTVDPYNAKVVRAAMGAHFRLPIRSLKEDSLSELLALEQRLLAESTGAIRYDEVQWGQPSAMIIGSEAHGPSPRLRELATGTVAIPLQRNVESLNAAVAASIMLFEAQRQRRFA